MHHHIVAGYDGSKVSAAAASWALDEAARRNVGVTVLACCLEPTVADFGVSPSDLSAVTTVRRRDATQAHVDELVAVLAQRRPGVPVNGLVVHGSAPQQMVAQAAHADLLVIGATGSSGSTSSFMGSIATSFMGSVTRAVIHNSPCPVVVVPGDHHMPERPRVVIGVDGTVRSDMALDWGVDECDLLRGQLEVVHAYSYPYATTADASGEARDLMRIDAAVTLERAIDRARMRGGSMVEGHLVEERPARALTERAQAANLVVIGTRRLEPQFLHLGVLGSVAETVVGRPPCPVAVVPEGILHVRP